MRVVAGIYKKTPLKTLEGDDITRPTKDMVKEALFSTINIYSDTYFLDLFAGSGAIGIEALSRGAKEVIFNDINKKACNIINLNLEKIKENRTVYNLDYQECLKKLEGKKFDYIFLDPPYKFNAYEEMFFYINKYDVLKDDGVVIFEVKSDTTLNDNYLDITLYKEKKYGISKLEYFRKAR